MKRYFTLTQIKLLMQGSFVVLISLLVGCQSDVFTSNPPCEFPENLDSYNLVWADEFEATDLDTSKWTALIGNGCDQYVVEEGDTTYLYGGCDWGNNERQYYSDAKANLRIEDGNLIITAKEENPPMNGYQYTSARITTRDKFEFKYGRIDVRAKMPFGQGLWPAIWLLPTESKYGTWPKSGEIDVMELVGNEPNKTFSTVHYGHDYWRFTGYPYYLEPGDDFAQDFHTFSLFWAEGCIRFQVDGEWVGEPITPSTTLPTTYPFDQLFHLILNVAVGGNLPGDPDGSTQFPQKMTVDFARVYQVK